MTIEILWNWVINDQKKNKNPVKYPYLLSANNDVNIIKKLAIEYKKSATKANSESRIIYGFSHPNKEHFYWSNFMSSYTHNTKVYGWKDKKFVFFSKQTSISPDIFTLSVSFGRCGSRTFSHTHTHTHTYTITIAAGFGARSCSCSLTAIVRRGGWDGMGCSLYIRIRDTAFSVARGKGQALSTKPQMHASTSFGVGEPGVDARALSRASSATPSCWEHTYNPIPPHTTLFVHDFRFEMRKTGKKKENRHTREGIAYTKFRRFTRP